MGKVGVATAAVAEAKGNNSWQFPLNDRRSPLNDRRSPLTDYRLSLLDRQQSDHEPVTRRKSTDNLRSRNSWRWSWKNVLPKPFQNQSTTRSGGFREKVRKKTSSSEPFQNVSKNSVETRKKMDKLLRLWHTEIVDSSDDSSDDDDDDRSLLGRRRSCSPRIIGNESSSSEDDEDDLLSEIPVSLYASEGPSRMVFSTELEVEEINENVPVVDEADPPVDNSDGMSQRSLLQERKCAVEVNSNLEALTGLGDMINHVHNNSVIAPLQICHLERCVDIPKQIKHSCSISREQRSADVHGDLNSPEGNAKSNEVSYDCTRTGCASRGSGGTGCGHPELAKPDGHRLSLPSPQDPCLKGTIEAVRKDFLSVSLQNKQLELGKEELINASHNEDSLREVPQLRKDQGSDNKLYTTTSEMDDLFSSQDLNAIRKFLGMSLQQIDANKMLENGSVEAHHPTVVSLGNLMEYGNEQQVSREQGQLSTVKDVLPDYPSTYPKTDSGETKEQNFPRNEEESCNLQCVFKDFGCPFPDTGCALDLENHIKSNVAEHLKLVSKTAQEQKEQLKDHKLLQEKQAILIQQLTATVHNLKSLVQEQITKNQSQEKLVVSLKDQLKEQRKQSQRFERDISYQFQTLSQSTSTTLPTSPPSTAELLWPIKNFKKRLLRARDGEVDDPIISEAFYTGPYGYKLSIWVYLNGRGKNVGSHISVYARVMQGEHDMILSWPVRPVYTFTLFDQSDGEKENIVRTRKVNDIKRDGGKHHGIDRPGGGDRSVIAGFDDFIAHDQLEKRNYLADDCLYLKLDAKLLC